MKSMIYRSKQTDPGNIQKVGGISHATMGGTFKSIFLQYGRNPEERQAYCKKPLF